VVILTQSVTAQREIQAKERGSGGDGRGDKEDTEQDEYQMSKDEENLLDAQTIFKYNLIKKKNPTVNVVTELINQENIAYLLDDPMLFQLMNKYNYDQTPTFASGEAYLSSLMDSLICQAFYNSALTIVLRHLIVGDSKKGRKRAQGGNGGTL